MKFYVYKANLIDLDGSPTKEEIKFCCSSMRWLSLREEIENGEKLLDPSSLRLIHWTEDRNEARSMATEL